eukprot:5076220-Prymnesium_polylepis.1
MGLTVHDERLYCINDLKRGAEGKPRQRLSLRLAHRARSNSRARPSRKPTKDRTRDNPRGHSDKLRWARSHTRRRPAAARHQGRLAL